MSQLLNFHRRATQAGANARVNPASVLAPYLTGVYVPGTDASFAVYDRRGGSHLRTYASTPSKVSKQQGIYVTDVGQQAGFAFYDSCIPVVTYPVVIIGAGYFTDAAGNWAFISLWPSGAPGGGYRCDIELESSSSIAYSIRNNFGTTATVSATGLSGVTSGAFFICVAQSLSQTDHRFYVGGAKFTSSTDAGTIASPFDKAGLCNAGTGGTSPGNSGLRGGLLFAAYGRQALPDTLALNLSRDPSVFWNMFGSRRILFAPPSSAAAVNLDLNPLVFAGAM